MKIEPQVKNEFLSDKRIHSQAFTATSGAESNIQETSEMKRIKKDEKDEETV